MSDNNTAETDTKEVTGLGKKLVVTVQVVDAAIEANSCSQCIQPLKQISELAFGDDQVKKFLADNGGLKMGLSAIKLSVTSDQPLEDRKALALESCKAVRSMVFKNHANRAQAGDIGIIDGVKEVVSMYLDDAAVTEESMGLMALLLANDAVNTERAMNLGGLAELSAQGMQKHTGTPAVVHKCMMVQGLTSS
eukprot:GFYU01003971.1.p1 GENE.GFYU01003971.1~~GFYU01003971.1.p1  ORF type:complete len:193 (-),score=72.35 GFYU01003971.1:124-702(-)